MARTLRRPRGVRIGTAPDPPPAPLGEELCANPVAGTGFPGTLLRVGCEGALEPGRAHWSVLQGAVTLDIAPGSDGLRGAELAAAWPSLDEPPWLGHRVERIVVLPGDRIRVVFAGPAPDPARVFADPRLAGKWRPPEDGDGRDAIDLGDAGVVTRHDASIEYARSLGRSVQLVAFDQLYMVAFVGTAELTRAGELAAEVGEDWIRWGAAGARRRPSLNWLEIVDQCGTGLPESAGAAASTGRAGRPSGIGATHGELSGKVTCPAGRLRNGWRPPGCERARGRGSSPRWRDRGSALPFGRRHPARSGVRDPTWPRWYGSTPGRSTPVPCTERCSGIWTGGGWRGVGAAEPCC